MKIFFDTSVLVPAFYKFDTHHNWSAEVLLAASRENSFCALRTLGEVFAVLTGLPVRPRMTGREGMAIVDQIREKLTVISLTDHEFVSAIRSASGIIVGGAVYDALIARCALKAKAEVLLTWNVRDFRRLGPEVTRIVKTPAEL